MKHLLLFLLVICFFSSCEKTEITNDEIRNLVPGGVVTFSLMSPTQGAFSVVNDTVSTYGCFQDEGELKAGDDINFYVRISGMKNNVFYYFQGKGSISAYQFELIKADPGMTFPLYNISARINIIEGSNTFFTTLPSVVNEVPGSMTISNYGKVGDPVSVNFTFNTSTVAGFSDMTGNVKTRYVIYNF